MPTMLGKGKWQGELFWATAYTLILFIPLSIPRSVGKLRINSLLGVLASIYVVLCLVMMFLFNKDLVPDISYNIQNARYFKFSSESIIEGIPYVVYAYMYQPNIPMIYRELNYKSYNRMEKVISRGAGSVVVLYLFAAIFGYIGLVSNDVGLQTLIESKDVLEVKYNSRFFNVAVLGLLIATFAATPLCILPSKDTYEELAYPHRIMTKDQNLYVTTVMCLICYVLAVAIPGIGDAITILGCTTNSLIGFILPIVFYLKLFPEASKSKKIQCWVCLAFIITLSLQSLLAFIKNKTAGE